jgi:hypothetical protein
MRDVGELFGCLAVLCTLSFSRKETTPILTSDWHLSSCGLTPTPGIVLLPPGLDVYGQSMYIRSSTVAAERPPPFSNRRAYYFRFASLIAVRNLISYIGITDTIAVISFP